MPHTVRRLWLQLSWAAIALLPLLIIAVQALAFQMGAVWFACAVYLWPAGLLAHQLGIAMLSPSYFACAALYCLALGSLVAMLLTRLLRLPRRVALRTAVLGSAVPWLPLMALLGFQLLTYKGFFSAVVACPAHLQILAPHCGEVRDLREHELSGFIDTTWLARFTVTPRLIETLLGSGEIHAVDPNQVPRWLWQQPPVWWRPPPPSASRVYVTPGFSFTNRGGDGDHYLFICDAQGEVFARLESNF